MHISSVGIDLGKTTFHLVALSEPGKVAGAEEVFAQTTANLHGKATTRTHLSKEINSRLPMYSETRTLLGRALGYIQKGIEENRLNTYSSSSCSGMRDRTAKM